MQTVLTERVFTGRGEMGKEGGKKGSDQHLGTGAVEEK